MWQVTSMARNCDLDAAGTASQLRGGPDRLQRRPSLCFSVRKNRLQAVNPVSSKVASQA